MKAKKPARTGLIIQPCRIKLRRLSKAQIDKWTKKSIKTRTVSISSNVSSVGKSKAIISDSSSSSSDDEKEVMDKKKNMVPNPLFIDKEGKSEEEIKNQLLDKLCSLLSSKETAADDDDKAKESSPEAAAEKKSETKASEKQPKEKVEQVENLPLIYGNNKEAIDVKKIADCRQFAQLLMIEMGSLAFLGNYRITIKDLEQHVHQIIGKLETPRPLEKPSSLPSVPAYEKVKYKIKDCKLKLKDIKDSEDCKKALASYQATKMSRIRRKKSKLLHYLTFLAEHRKAEAAKRKAVSDDDSDSEIGSKPSKKMKHDDQLGGFK